MEGTNNSGYSRRMKTSNWIKYDPKSGLWIQSNKRIYLYWYSFLQHAVEDRPDDVDWSKYEGWGGRDVIPDTKFDSWWRERWKTLFGYEQGGEPKFSLSRGENGKIRPKENGLRYALLVYENRDKGDMWEIAKHIAKREWRHRKLGLTSRAFDYASPQQLKQKQDAEERSYRKRYTQSKVARYKKNADTILDNVCKGQFL
jgi:hypothetical protein